MTMSTENDNELHLRIVLNADLLKRLDLEPDPSSKVPKST